MPIKQNRPVIKVPGDKTYTATCCKCGEFVAEFDRPGNVEQAIESGGGTIVKDAYHVEDIELLCYGCSK
jgi:hypothetical protein